jgi:hypothetical protein
MNTRGSTPLRQEEIDLPLGEGWSERAAAAVFGRDGRLRKANAAFARLMPAPAAAGTDLRDQFVNPRFDQFAARRAGADGSVFRGILNLADAAGKVRSFRGGIFVAGPDLVVIADAAVSGGSAQATSRAEPELERDGAGAARRVVIPEGVAVALLWMGVRNRADQS